MTDVEVFDEILSHFQIVNRYQDKAQAKCPAHDDRQASLTITKGQKCILFKCHAGCKTDDVLRAAGLELKDTFYEQRQSNIAKWKAYVEVREKRKIEAIYNYYSLHGDYAYTKLRLENKKIIYGKLDNDRFTYGLGHDKPRKSYMAVYGSIKAVKKSISEGRTIFIPEGEKDVDTLSKKGYTAFTYGGCNDWIPEFADLVSGADVIILADNDKPGITVANNILHDIKGVVKSAKIIVPMQDIPKADITDYFEQGHTVEEFEELIKSSVTESKPVANTSIYDKLIALDAVNKFETNDKGFGRLYAEVYKDKHRYNPSRKDFMMYDGKRWIDDIEGMGARSDAKYLSDILVKYAVDCGSGNGAENHYLQNVIRLASIRQRENMVRDAKDIYYFTNESLDQNDYLLNVQNGTLDLSEDTPRFMPHSPDMLLSKICNAEYNPNATCEEWNSFLMEVMQNDTEKIKYLQKICGLSLTGCTQEETCFILYGSTTRNGKSTFCETIIHLLGDYALTMKPETLAVKPNSDSRTASGDIARLAGCRFCNASEPPKKMLFDTALLKSLLGRDSITTRHLYQREFSFIPKFKLVVNTNYLPSINDDTVFSSGRVNVISFDRHFSESEQDKTLKSRLQRKEELSGILNWAIEGLRLYRQEGLNPPQAVIRATEQYRSDSDKIGSFVSECLTWTGRNSKAKNVYEAYSKWCVDNGYGCENKGNFFSELKSKGMFAVSGTIDGKTFRNIVKGYTIEAEFTDIPKSEQMLFK